MKRKLISGLVLFFFATAILSAQEEERHYPEKTRAEQRKIQTLLEDAESDLNNVPSYLQSQLYSGAEVILLRAQGRLKQAQAALDVHPEMIQITYSFNPFVGVRKVRDELTDSYRALRNEFQEIEKQAVAVMKDFERLNPNSQLGYRTELIGYFESLLNSIEDPEMRTSFEAILEKIRNAVENDDLGALQKAFEDAFQFISANKDSIGQVEITSVPDVPVSMEGWKTYLESVKRDILEIRESHPDLYAKLWAKYNLLIQAVAREDEQTARRLAKEIQSGLMQAGVEQSPQDIPGRDERTDDRMETKTPAMLNPSSVSSDGKSYVSFYNDTLGNLNQLSPEGRQKVVDLLEKLRLAILDEDWAQADRIGEQIRKVYKMEGRTPPEITGGGDEPGGNLQRDEDGNFIYVDPQTGEIIYFPADLTRPGIAREYIGGEGARLIREEKQFLERDGNSFNLETGESRLWSFKIQEDPNEVDFVDEGMKSMLMITDQNGKTTFTVEEWLVTNTETGEVIATTRSGKSLPVVFTDSVKYRVEVFGVTDWESPFRIEAILNISL